MRSCFAGILTASTILDRENVSKYHLIARAVDPGDNSCSMDVYITVSDVNDNSPVFEDVPQPVFVSEGADVNTLVYRVSATDADLGKCIISDINKIVVIISPALQSSQCKLDSGC